MPSRLPRVLFLDSANDARSHFAEAWARELHADVLEAVSAGTQPTSLDPRAMRAMDALGTHLSGHASKSIADVDPASLDLIVTLCDRARAHCPSALGMAQFLHQPFDDPARLARGLQDENEAIAQYERIAMEIRTFVQDLPFVIRDLIRG